MDADRLTEVDDRIDRFLRGEMSQEEESSFKKDLEQDDGLKSRAVTQAFLVRSMGNVGKIPNTYAGRITTPQAAAKISNVKPTINWKRMACVAAAIVVLIICCVPCVKYFQSTRLADSYLESSLIAYSVNRGGDSLTQQKVNDICKAVKDKSKISENIGKLETIRMDIKKDALCEYAYYEYDVTWYLALAYLEKGKRRAAIDVIEDYIKTNPSDPRISKMRKLLSDIKEISLLR